MGTGHPDGDRVAGRAGVDAGVDGPDDALLFAGVDHRFFSKSGFELAAKLAAGRRGIDARSFVFDRRHAFVWLRLAGSNPTRRGFWTPFRDRLDLSFSRPHVFA